MRCRLTQATTSVVQQDGPSMGSTWKVGGKGQEETGIKQQYDNCALKVKQQ